MESRRVANPVSSDTAGASIVGVAAARALRLTTGSETGFLLAVKLALLLLGTLAVGLSACTTLENRRDMYCGYGHVCGPYTCGKYKEKTQVVLIESTDYKSVK